jgi:nitrous oxidase accessory protein NosD
VKLKYFLVLLLALFIEHLTFNITYATVRYVSKTGSSTPPYTSWETASDSIQKCINLCVNGDTIYVANGVYKENLVINTALSLIGSSMDSTVIDGRGMGDYTILNFNPLSIENFNLIGKGENTVGTRCIQFYSNLIIKNCQLTEAGLALGSVGSDIDAKDLIIKNLRVRAFSLYGSNNNNISDCVIILKNENANAIQIGFAQNGNYEIRNNIILFTGSYNPGNGISIGAPRRVVINNNLISGFTDNIFIDLPQDTVIIINNILNYQFVVGGYPASINAGNNRFKVRNVILARNKYAIIASGSPKIDYNIF